MKLSKDWRAFLASEFALSKTLADSLKVIPAEEVTNVQRAFRDAVKQGGDFRIKLGTSSAPGELSIQPAGSGAPTRTIKITIIRCTFDANFRHWHCKLFPLT